MDGQMDGRTNRRMDKQMDGQGDCNIAPSLRVVELLMKPISMTIFCPMEMLHKLVLTLADFCYPV